VEEKLTGMALHDFLSLLASNRPAPGGGTVAALEGALGASLARMVLALTEGKKKYASSQELVAELSPRTEELRLVLEDLADRDTEAFDAVSAAYALPKETDGEKETRANAVQQALKKSVGPPLAVMERAVEALSLVHRMLGGYNRSAASDLGVGVLSLQAAAQGAWLNVLINLSGMKDEAFVRETREKGSALAESAGKLAGEAYARILEDCGGSV